MRNKFLTRSYAIFIRKRSNDSILENLDLLKDFRKIRNPLGFWIADPFLINFKGKNYVFAEKLGLFNGKGEIVYKCIDNDFSRWHKAISRKFHLSFPNIFEINGEFFMVPESANDDDAIWIYKTLNSFKKWEKNKLIFKKQGYHPVDSVSFDKTPFSENICTYCSINNKKSLLFLKNSNNGFVINQIINDDSLTLRPAGNAFNYKSQLVMPFQDCSVTYGGGVIFRNIVHQGEIIGVGEPFLKIDASTIQDLLKQKKATGVHTYNQNSTFEIIDIKFLKFSFLGFADKIFEKIFKK